jgi:NAD(P)-dependent dehydrogenase (short-subunit alcohol dehydrogenase family)
VVGMNASELFSLDGRRVVLTGASGFLGRTFAQTLLENGAILHALGRSERLEALVDRWIGEFGAHRVVGHRVDMYDLPAFERVLDDIASTGAVDVLVNNAYELGLGTGFNSVEGTLESSTYDQWSRHFTSGLYWPALAAQKLGPGMVEQRHGSIITIATMYAAVAPDRRLYEGTDYLNPPGYSSAKAASVAFTRYVASFW